MSNPKMLYVLGVPGVGKTTALKAALEADEHWHARFTEPVAHTVHGWNRMPQNVTIHEIGAVREGGFSGTDGMPMSVQPKVLEWLESTRPSRVIAEGDRLANGKFFNAVFMMGYDLSVVYLDAPPVTAQTRREERAKQHGLHLQNTAWLKGRTTKVGNLVEEWMEHLTVIDATKSPEQVAADLRACSFFDVIREE